MKRSPGLYKRIENFILLLMGSVLVLDIPLLVYDHFNPVEASTQAIYCLLTVAVGLFLTIWLTKKRGSRVRRLNDVLSKPVEVIRVKTNRAIKRKDFEDFGIAFYVDVADEGQQMALFLWGQYLDVLEAEGRFPNTEFEIVRLPNSDEFMEFKLLGHHFKEERTLPAFDKEIWQSGIFPVNGQLIDVPIDKIT